MLVQTLLLSQLQTLFMKQPPQMFITQPVWLMPADTHKAYQQHQPFIKFKLLT